MEEVTIEAVVLRRRDSGESDRRLTVFSRELGKIDLVAKGARKPTSRLAAVSEPLSWARFTFAPGKRTSYVTQAQMMSRYKGLRKDYDRLQSALAYLELCEQVLPYGLVEAETFQTINLCLEHLDSHPKPLIANVWCQVKLLEVTGHLPSFESSEDGTDLSPGLNWYSLEAGGLCSFATASTVRDSFQVSAEILLALARLTDLDSPPGNIVEAKGCNSVLFRTWLQIVQAELSATKTLLELYD